MTVTSFDQARPKHPLGGHVDVLIVGAGISGIAKPALVNSHLVGQCHA